jgi:hypothetical protein
LVATATTTEFNALCNLTPAMMLRLEILAFSGTSPVSNAFTQEADRLGLTTVGRERKEREEQRKFAAAIEAIRQRAAEFLKQLDLLEQASMEALLQNELRLRTAREDLRSVRDRAYEVTMPDGTVAKVYRDGDKVRDDEGMVVDSSVVRADDLPESSPSWRQRREAGESVARLEAERNDIIEYQKRVARAKETASSDDMTPDQLDAMQADVARMPEAVRRHYSHEAAERAAIDAPGAAIPRTLNTDVSPTRDFSAALRPKLSDPQFDEDFTRMPPSVSAPAPG